MSKPVFTMVVGLPGSGKSTYIDKYVATASKCLSVHSSDLIRDELTGSEENQSANAQVFEELHRRVIHDLKLGYDSIYDATNIHWKRRKAFLNSISNIDCYKRCVVIATPYEVCLKQNLQRERKVPEHVIDRMYKNFDIPYYNEGWDEILLYYADSEYKNMYGTYSQFVFDTLDYCQNNKHHTLSLGEHCFKTLSFIINHQNKSPVKHPKEKELRAAATIHDCGKPFTKEFKDSRRNTTEDAHYYNHEKVGSYNSLFYNYTEDLDVLYVSALIRWHMIMHHYSKWEEKTIERYDNEFGSLPDDFYSNLQLLYFADTHAH